MMNLVMLVSLMLILGKAGSLNRKERGLIVQEPWLSLILEGKKTMDLRHAPVNIRGRIALLNNGQIHGHAELVDVVGPLNRKELGKLQRKHRMADIPANYRYGWVFKNVKKLPEAVPYDHPQGAQTWVRL
jgi:hypothetical protein